MDGGDEASVGGRRGSCSSMVVVSILWAAGGVVSVFGENCGLVVSGFTVGERGERDKGERGSKKMRVLGGGRW